MSETTKQEQLSAERAKQEKAIENASDWARKYQRQSCPPGQVEGRDHVTKLLQVIRERDDAAMAFGRRFLGYLANPMSRPTGFEILQEVLCHIQSLDVELLRNKAQTFSDSETSISTQSKE